MTPCPHKKARGAAGRLQGPAQPGEIVSTWSKAGAVASAGSLRVFAKPGGKGGGPLERWGERELAARLCLAGCDLWLAGFAAGKGILP